MATAPAASGRAARRVSLVWYRCDDLRLLDHQSLKAAHAGSSHVQHVFCFDPRDFERTHAFKLPRYAGHRLRFLRESVRDLQRGMKARHGARLLVRVGPTDQVLASVAKAVGARTVFAHRGVCPEEKEREGAVRLSLRALGCELRLLWGNTLYGDAELPFEVASLPPTFSAFRKRVERLTLSPMASLPADDPAAWRPDPVDSTAAARLPALAEDEHTPAVLGVPDTVPPSAAANREGGAHSGEKDADADQDPRSVLPFRGGESEGRARIREWIWGGDHLRTYKETRNGSGTAACSSKLSPWLATGSLSPKMIMAEVSRYETERVANQSTYWLFFELLWRDFFRFMADKHGSQMFVLGGPRGEPGLQAWSTDPALFRAWTTGQTGYPLVDAHMRELRATGYMSNRGRQIVASFLTKDLGLDWRMGAEWFESNLLDHDPASNYGNWTYVAGVGCDPREGRYFNIVKQGRTYDPAGDFVRLWCPELKALPTDLLTAATRTRAQLDAVGATAYPTPVVPLRHSGYKGAPGAGGRGGGKHAHGSKGPHRQQQPQQKKKKAKDRKGNGNFKRSRLQTPYM